MHSIYYKYIYFILHKYMNIYITFSIVQHTILKHLAFAGLAIEKCETLLAIADTYYIQTCFFDINMYFVSGYLLFFVLFFSEYLQSTGIFLFSCFWSYDVAIKTYSPLWLSIITKYKNDTTVAKRLKFYHQHLQLWSIPKSTTI